VRETGPGPERTARGAGRLALVEPRLEERAGLRLLLLPVLRDRELEPPLEPLRLEPLRDVLELRDPDGEDVRVAMVINLSHSHISHMDHTSVSPEKALEGLAGADLRGNAENFRRNRVVTKFLAWPLALVRTPT
jgi:hypothetical protein